jgi:glutamine amidotransferase
MLNLMCDLFGMSCNESDRAIHSLPRFALYAPDNPDGWGMGWFNGNTATVKRAPGRADLDALFEESTGIARSHTIVAHVRSSTGGVPCECNCHPFKRNHRGRDWLLAHNGWVTNVQDHPDADGETDSEQIFHQIMDKVAEYPESGSIRGQYPALKKAIRHILDTYGRDIRLNLLISDGHNLYVYHHYPGKPIYMLRRSKNYGGAVLVSTRRLTDEDWEEIPVDKLLSINHGEIQVISDAVI